MNVLEVTVFTIFYSLATCDSQWIDPFDVDFVGENRENSVDPFTNDDPIAVKPTANVCTKPSSDAMLYYKRTINLLLAAVALDEMSGGHYKGRLLIDMSAKDYDVLREFTSGDFQEPLMLQKIDQILCNTLEMKLADKVELALMTWMDIWFHLLFTRTAGVMLIILCVMFVVYKLFKARFTTKEIVWYVVILGWAFDFFFTWKRMLQGLEISKLAQSHLHLEVPADCFPDKMSAWQTVWSYLRTTSDCEKYYKAMMYDIIWDVGPLDVIAHQSRIMVQVFGNLGGAVAQLVSGLLGVIPYPFNLLLLLPMMLFTLLLISMILVFCTNSQVSVNIMYLFQLKKNSQEKIVDREEIQEIGFKKQSKMTKLKEIMNKETKKTRNKQERTSENDTKDKSKNAHKNISVKVKETTNKEIKEITSKQERTNKNDSKNNSKISDNNTSQHSKTPENNCDNKPCDVLVLSEIGSA